MLPDQWDWMAYRLAEYNPAEYHRICNTCTYIDIAAAMAIKIHDDLIE
jgi:hypothetical protein